MDKIKVSDIKSLVIRNRIVWTDHLTLRFIERGIKRADVLECIEKCEIIEKYPDLYPSPACLIYALLKSGKALHVVVGIKDELLYIITAYYPTLVKWENDFKTRKKVK